MINSKEQSRAGQALVEYLLLFSFVTFLAIGMVRGLGKTLTTSIGYIGYELTEQFTIGVCPTLCFYNDYKNQEKGK
jgi:Flp pilus assembly pilin Flp